jgi:hypothetical protein
MEYVPPAPCVNVKAPLIYMWEIHDQSGQLLGRYIGKANGGEKRPTQHYPRNVNKLRQGRPYKNGKNYRRVHYAMADAVEAGHRISLTYLCNVSDVDDIFKVESQYIKEYGCDADDGIGLNGRWKGMPREVVVAERAMPAHFRADMEADNGQDADAEGAPMPIDLDDFLEYFEDKPREALKIVVNGKSCSVWSDGKRILRAKQDRPGSKIWIKLVQSSWRTKTDQLAWDGSDSQIEAALEAERKVLRARGGDPRF